MIMCVWNRVSSLSFLTFDARLHFYYIGLLQFKVNSFFITVVRLSVYFINKFINNILLSMIHLCRSFVYVLAGIQSSLI